MNLEDACKQMDKIVQQSEDDLETRRICSEARDDSAFSKKFPRFAKKRGFENLLGFESERLEDVFHGIAKEYHEWNEAEMEWLSEKDDISTNDVGREVTRDYYYPER